MNWKRLSYLSRLLRPSAWRFLALAATDPRLDGLYATQGMLGTRSWFAEPAPWLTEQGNELLQQLVKPGMSVLEWGSGSSTLWFVKSGCVVTAIEHDRKWFDEVCERIPAPSKLLYIEEDANYTHPVATLSEYDVIVIDGRRRHECASWVAEAAENRQLRSPCYVVFDDAQRPAYREARDRLDRLAFQHFPCTGATGIPLDKLTSIFVLKES